MCLSRAFARVDASMKQFAPGISKYAHWLNDDLRAEAIEKLYRGIEQLSGKDKGSFI
jgi:DNA-directed RNA polymerase specialized sigma24 family protein